PSPAPLLSVTAPRTPSSTLFPYTTLFRSDVEDRPDPLQQLGEQAVQLEMRERGVGRRLQTNVLCFPAGEHARRIGASSTARTAPDRKSTRLNSSHQIISYAVFCLKKKK